MTESINNLCASGFQDGNATVHHSGLASFKTTRQNSLQVPGACVSAFTELLAQRVVAEEAWGGEVAVHGVVYKLYKRKKGVEGRAPKKPAPKKTPKSKAPKQTPQSKKPTKSPVSKTKSGKSTATRSVTSTAAATGIPKRKTCKQIQAIINNRRKKPSLKAPRDVPVLSNRSPHPNIFQARTDKEKSVATCRGHRLVANDYPDLTGISVCFEYLLWVDANLGRVPHMFTDGAI
jgi:hypothetical protein